MGTQLATTASHEGTGKATASGCTTATNVERTGGPPGDDGRCNHQPGGVLRIGHGGSRTHESATVEAGHLDQSRRKQDTWIGHGGSRTRIDTEEAAGAARGATSWTRVSSVALTTVGPGDPCGMMGDVTINPGGCYGSTKDLEQATRYRSATGTVHGREQGRRYTSQIW